MNLNYCADPILNRKNDASPVQSTIKITTAPISAVPHKPKSKRRLKLGASSTLIDPDLAEIAVVAVLFNLCFLVVFTSESFLQKVFYITVANVVVLRTLNLRAARARQVSTKLESLIEEHQDAAAAAAAAALVASSSSIEDNHQLHSGVAPLDPSEGETLSTAAALTTDIIKAGGKPTPGSNTTFATLMVVLLILYLYCSINNVPDYRYFLFVSIEQC